MELHGRREIFIDEKEINEKNIEKILSDAFMIHEANRMEIEYLLKYERGEQPILTREKKIRPEINIKCQENHAAEITAFKLGYEFGSPITFVQRAKKEIRECDPRADDSRIAFLNEMMFEENKPAKDIQLARFFKICGVAYRFIYPKRKVTGVSPFDMLILNPLNTFVIKSNNAYKDIVAGVTYSERIGDSTKIIGVYTNEWYFEIDTANPGKVRKIANQIGKIPIIEYINDYTRMGCFERVLALMDALNTSSSDRINDLAQHVQSILWGDNVTIDSTQYAQLRDDGMIITTSEQGRQAILKYLESILNQSEVQTLTDYLYEQILQISGCPGREKSTGGNTGSAILLSNGWQLAETQAKSMELIFSESERKMLDVVLEIIKNTNGMPDEIKGLCVSDVLTKFSRNKTYDLVSRVNAMVTMLKNGIDPNKAISVVDIFDDSQQATIDSLERIDKILFSKEQNNKSEEPDSDGEEAEQPSSVPNTDK